MPVKQLCPSAPLTRTGFGRCSRASTTVETAITVAGLVGVAALIVNIATALFEEDRKSRAAQAVARALALGSQVAPCDLVREEFGFGPDFTCVDDWQITLNRNVKPSEIASAPQTGTGDMVVVRIGVPNLDTVLGIAQSEPTL